MRRYTYTGHMPRPRYFFRNKQKKATFFFFHSSCNFLIMSACTGVLPRLSCRPMVKFNQQLKYMTSAVVRQCVCVCERKLVLKLLVSVMELLPLRVWI